MPDGKIVPDPRNPTKTHCSENWVKFPWSPSDLNNTYAAQTCSQLLGILNSALNYCDDMCNQATHKPSPSKPGCYDPNDEWLLMSLCCENSPISYGVFNCDGSGDTACWLKCTLKHEQPHVGQCTGTVPFPIVVANPGSWAESDVYRTSVDCLLTDALARSGGKIPSDVLARVKHFSNKRHKSW